MIKKQNGIYLAGHTGLLGSALSRLLKARGFSLIITKPHAQLNLTQQANVEKFFKKTRPEYVILAAARVGGIQINRTLPGQFIYENLSIETNVIHASHKYGVKKLLFFASACSYPRDCPQPMKEEYFLTGRPEPTNLPYAVAKIAGAVLCEAYRHQYGSNFICAVPTNAYGPGDHFDPQHSHVIPALIRKFHLAKLKDEPKVILWGSGRPKREFIFADDLADASLFLMQRYNSGDIINVGSGEEISVRRLACLIKGITGFKGGIVFDASKPDGAPRKILDSSKLNNLGWKARVKLEVGIEKTYHWYLNHLTAHNAEN